MAIHFIGGLLEHAPSLPAFCAPTTNSYRRLVPGFEAPVNLIYSQRNRTACIRVPVYSSREKATRLEFRCPDPSCNPYLALSALEEDHDYLMRGDMFAEDLIETWVGYKRSREIDFVQLRPHPAEFELYYEV